MSNHTPTDLIETYLTGVTANLGYPVGMGMPANPDTVRKWAVDIAKLAGIAAAIEAERERCAKVAEECTVCRPNFGTRDYIAAAIRAGEP